MPLKRIAIFGMPGSGKSNYANWLGDKLGLPVYHLDRIFFGPRWVARPEEDFLADQKAWLTKEEWIIDGNSMRSLELRFQRANKVIYLRENRFICTWRLFKRWVLPDKHIEDLPPGCTKSVSWRLLKYLWTFERRYQEKIVALRKLYPKVEYQDICGCAKGNAD